MARDELEETRSLLGTLIGFPTVSSESNLALIDFCAERLEALGARLQVTRDATGAKANLFATIGPDIDGGVVLSGHTDVVPVEGQPWTSDPFQAVDNGETVTGRGACDMKDFIAAALAMAPRFADAPLALPLHLAFTHDEEVGCFGAARMLDALVETGRRPRVCIIGEPTGMRIIEGHKGGHEYTTEFTGLEGHASLPDQGVNAIEYAARFIGKLLETQEELKTRAPRDSRFDPPYSTIQTGVIHGGIARNVIPRHCTLDWEMRPVSRADADYALSDIRRYASETLLPMMRAVSPDATIVTHVIGEIPGLEPMTDSEAVALARALTGENASEVVSFGTEAGLFQAVGIDTVVCGPGSIEQAHKPDEFVTLDQLDQCLAMIERLIPRLAA
jgi:acetylornithine deacetylase